MPDESAPSTTAGQPAAGFRRYHLGCPIWSNRRWIGSLFTRSARAADFLRQYAAVFNTVEGNTTFYAVPSADTVARWAEETPAGFRFSFKLPRSITHERRLVDADAEVAAFLERMSPLGERLGPFMLQLPPGFGPAALPILEAFLDRWAMPKLAPAVNNPVPDPNFLPEVTPETLKPTFAVEVRHPGFFDGGAAEAALEALLEAYGADRVILDTRPLRAADASIPEVRTAQQRKPDLPVRFDITGRQPILRYIAHAELAANDAWLAEWAGIVAGWIAEGRTPFVFIHAPDDTWAPPLARRFHTLLAERADVGEMPVWPGEADDGGAQPVEARQLGLFG